MKLWELAKELYLKNGNVRCSLEVETESVKKEFGRTYEGRQVNYGGVYGRIGDIPAYLGGCEVKRVSDSPDVFDGLYTIII